MTPKEIKEIDTLLRVLRKHGVESFKKGEIELKVSPVKYINSIEKTVPSKGKEVSEEDLYYSATTLKPRGR